MTYYEAVTHYDELRDKYLANTQRRFTPVIKETRKRTMLDLKETANKINKQISRFSIPIKTEFSHTGIHIKSIGYHDDFCVFSTFFALVPTVRQQLHSLEIIPTKLRITKHAIDRHQEHESHDSIKQALYSIGEALLKADMEIGNKTLEGKRVYGTMVRQIETRENGLIFASFENPQEDNYRDMEASVITYIDEGRRRHWNERELEKEFAMVDDYIDVMKANTVSIAGAELSY